MTRSRRSAAVVVALSVGLVLGAVATAAVAHRSPSGATATTRDHGSVLSNATIVRRCLPQLTRTPEPGELPDRVRPLSVATVQVAKPLLDHRAGDLVGFVGLRVFVDGTRQWTRLSRPCRVPGDEGSAAPGSRPLPASATRPSASRTSLDVELCSEASDASAVVGDPEGLWDGTQVVLPDLRGFRTAAAAWRGPHGLTVLSDPPVGTVAVCDLGASSAGTRQVWAQAASAAPAKVGYLNGDRADGTPDRYWLAGITPSSGLRGRVRARTIVVRPPHRPEHRCRVSPGRAGGLAVGYYACVVEFRAVQAPLGTEHTTVEVLDASGTPIWRGVWDVGIEGH